MTKVVYIDDEANTEGMASKFEVMREFGLDVVPVTEIENALPALHSAGKLGAIVVDRIMPPHNVYSLEETNGGTSTGLRLLRDICKEFPFVPILVVSVMKDTDIEAKSADLRIARYITKPVDGEELARQILEVIGGAA